VESGGVIAGRDWRAEAFGRTGRTVAILGVPSVLVALVAGWLKGAVVYQCTLISAALVLVFVGVTSADQHRWRAHAAILILALAVLSLVFFATYGVGANGTAALVALSVLGAIFFSGRALWFGIVLGAVTLVATGAAVHAGLLHPPDPRVLFDWSRTQTWLRVAAFFVFAASLAASPVSALIARLERGLAQEHHARSMAEAAQRRSQFLAEASRILGSSLDYEGTLRRVAELSTAGLFCDYCVVDVIARDGSTRRLVAGDAANAALLSKPDTQSCVSVPLVSRDHVLGALTFVRDHERAIEEGDVEAAEELGRRVAAAVDNSRLFEAAQQAVVAREEFLAVAAHEFRTPVTSLKLALQLVARRARAKRMDEEAVLKAVSIAERQADALARIVDGFVETSSMRAGYLPLVLSEVDLGDVVRVVAAQLREPLRASGSELAVRGDGAVLGQWDRSRLVHVVRALLSNAIKFGRGRPIDVTVHGDRDRALLIVRDRGLGIPREARDRIFLPFERAAPVCHFGGVGLGLYLARRIVQAHGGDVEYTSAEHQGSTFTVTLPLRHG
jgi:signal transduction histidine kinase